jgi:hypothetical protein
MVACFGVFLTSILYEYLLFTRTAHVRLLTIWITGKIGVSRVIERHSLLAPEPQLSPIPGRIIRAVHRLVLVSISYLLMLMTMSYNIGLFLSVVLGLATGSLIFAPESADEVFAAGIEGECCG